MKNYYPFGMLMPDMSWQSSGYRYGFGGHENDNDVKGEGNHSSFGDYGYDPRTVRRYMLEPMIVKYPSLSPYVAYADNPLLYSDPSGLEIYIVEDFYMQTTCEIMQLTASGSEFWNKYKDPQSDKDIHIDYYKNYWFFGLFSVPKFLVEKPYGLTLRNINGTKYVSNGILQLDNKNFKNFFLRNVTNSAQKEALHLMVIHKDIRVAIENEINQNSGVITDRTVDLFLFSVFVMSHEGYAHVDIGTGNGDKDHDIYGKASVYWKYIDDNYGNIMDKLSNDIDKNKPEFKIFKDLMDLRNNNMELLKSTIRNKYNQFNPADNPNDGFDTPLGPEGTE
jgi:hypothetical protein